jgi:tetratricopeptide (TPR) repeat protein
MTDFIPLIQTFLKQNPENQFIHFLLGDHLLEAGRLEEAEIEFKKITSDQEMLLAEAGIARIFFQKQSYLACAVILKSIMSKGLVNVNVLTLYTRCLIKEEFRLEAASVYRHILQLNPKYEDPEFQPLLLLAGTN